MEIPAGLRCLGCPFWYVAPKGKMDHCCNQDLAWKSLAHTERSNECFCAYPHGATVRIEAKEEKP